MKICNFGGISNIPKSIVRHLNSRYCSHFDIQLLNKPKIIEDKSAFKKTIDIEVFLTCKDPKIDIWKFKDYRTREFVDCFQVEHIFDKVVQTFSTFDSMYNTKYLPLVFKDKKKAEGIDNYYDYRIYVHGTIKYRRYIVKNKGKIISLTPTFFYPNTKYSKITHDVVLDLYEKQHYSMIEVKKHFEKFYNVDIPLYDLYEMLKRVKKEMKKDKLYLKRQLN